MLHLETLNRCFNSPYKSQRELAEIIIEYGKSGNFPTVLSRLIRYTVGSGARESIAVQVGAIIPHTLMKLAHDSIESVPVLVVDLGHSIVGSYMSSFIDATDSCAFAWAENAKVKILITIIAIMVWCFPNEIIVRSTFASFVYSILLSSRSSPSIAPFL